PTQETSGYVTAEYGSYDTAKVQAALGGALTNNFSARIAGIFSRHGAFLKNDYDPASPTSFLPSTALQAVGGGQDLGREVNYALRGHFLMHLGDSATFLISANWARANLSTPWYQSDPTAAVIDSSGRLRNEIRQPRDSTAQAFSFETG